MNRCLRPKRYAGRTCTTFLGIVIFAVTISAAVLQAGICVSAASLNLPSMSLKIIAANGTQLILNSDDIASLPFFRAYGGFVNQIGNAGALGNYTGVPLMTLCNLAGGLSNGSSLLISASDNYSMTLSYEQVNGNWTTYTQASGHAKEPQTQPLTPILAYYYNDANLSSNQGPLRLAIVGSEGLLTDSAFWVYSVVEIRIIDASVPEFSISLIIPAFILATVMAMLICSDKLGTGKRLSVKLRK